MSSSNYSALGHISTWRQRNPRVFLFALGASLVIIISLLGYSQDPYEMYYESSLGKGNNNQDSSSSSSLSSLDESSADDLDWAPKNLKKAVKRAEALWENNVKKRKQFIAEQGGLAKIREFSDKAHTWGQGFTLWDIFVPSYPCPWETERVGRMADGGKYTCGLPRIQQTRGKKCVVYSFGVERESSWEAEILERSDCEIFMYDYSVSEFGPQLKAMDPAMSRRAHFFQYGIGDKDEVVDGHQFYTLTSLMKQNGHDWIDILKVDVEGAEFKILPDIINEFGMGDLPFSQLLLEIHAQYTKHSYNTEDFGLWWEELELAGLRAFSSEINYPAIHWNLFPTAMEMNFLNTCNGRAKCGTLLRD